MASLAANVVSGSYTATWNGGAALGLTEDGFNIIWSFEKEDITGDSYGDSVIDAVYRGGNVFVEFNMKEYVTTTIEDLIAPYETTNYGAHGVAGRMDVNSSLTGALVLTDVDTTPAASVTNPIWTFHETIIDNGHEVSFALNNRHRIIPIRLRCYPTVVSTVNRWWTCSS